MRTHLHLLIRAELERQIGTPVRARKFLRDAVALAGMRVLSGPHAVLCKTPGNEGVSATVILDYSSASLHEWPHRHGSSVIQFDLYTCGSVRPTAELFMPLLGSFGAGRVISRLIDRDSMVDL